MDWLAWKEINLYEVWTQVSSTSGHKSNQLVNLVQVSFTCPAFLILTE